MTPAIDRPESLAGRFRRLAGFIRRVVRQTLDDRVPGQAARLSYYFLLAVFPLLLFLTALLGLTVQSSALLEQALQEYLRAIAPPSAFGALDSTLREITAASGSAKLSFGLVFSLWAASSGMVAIIEALNIAYDVAEVRRWWKRRLVAIVLTLGYALLVSCALLLLLYGSQAIEWLADRVGLNDLLARAWNVASWVLVLAFILLAFNILYVYAPNVRHRRWRWLMPGTVVALVLWLAASYGLRIYLSFFDRYTATYGSIGAVIVLLLWLYLTGMAVLIGGEVNSALERAAGEVEQGSDA